MLTIVRIWSLDPSVILDLSDLDYCKTHSIQLEAEQGKHERVETSSGQVYHYRISSGVTKLTTFDEKSECMLQLRYSDQVTLLSKFAIDSATIPYTT